MAKIPVDSIRMVVETVWKEPRTPLKSEQNLAHKKDRLAWGEEDDEHEAGHDNECAQEYLARAESGNQPSVKNCSED